MKKTTLTVACLCMLIASTSLTSCIGSFALTQRVMKWNNQVGSKLLNELVFFAFWVIPVYEVTATADLLVLNSIEFWSGSNPVTAYEKTVDTDHGRYLVKCDDKGYTITHLSSGHTLTLAHIDASDSWAIDQNGELTPFLTFVDDAHVRMILPDGGMTTVEISEEGLMAYRASVESSMMALR